MTHYDEHPILKMEADIIHLCGLRNLDPRTADEMYLWEIAAYLGLHRIETVAEHDAREILEKKQDYWDQTQDQRTAMMADYSTRRRERDLERRRQRSGRRGTN